MKLVEDDGEMIFMNEDLLTPVSLHHLMLAQFERYRNQKKPQLLKDNSSVPAMAEAHDFAPEFEEPPKSAFNKAGEYAGFFLKKAASEVYEYAICTHTSLTKFVEKEMESILLQSASAAKKMTDLTILFYGLHAYIATRKSVDLRKLLDEVDKRLWEGTPLTQIRNRRVAIKLDENGEQRRGTAEVVIDEQPLYNMREDRMEFRSVFRIQIENAKNLISHNTTLIDKALNGEIVARVSSMIRNTQPVEWPYRSLEQGKIIAQGEPNAWMGSTYQKFLGRLSEREYTLTAVANGEEQDDFSLNDRSSYSYHQGGQHFFSEDPFNGALALADPAIPLQLDDDQTESDYSVIQSKTITRVTL